jgi:hypothetical protein
VLASGAFLDIVSFVRYAVELRELHLTLRGVAILASVEPNLKVTLEGQGPSGVLELTIEISPDHPNQSHSFRVEVDQSYIPQLLEECERVIALYAVQRGAARGLPNLKYPS